MTATLDEVIAAVETAAAGDARQEREHLARLLDDLDLAQHADDEKLAYLAVLLDSLDMRDESVRVCRRGRRALTRSTGQGQSTLLNIEGMLAATHGEYDAAVSAFTKALSEVEPGTSLHTKLLANLAAVNLWAGRPSEAAGLVSASYASRQNAQDPAIDVLLTSVQAGLARLGRDTEGLQRAVSALEDASRSRVAQLGPDHPQAVVALGNLSSVEIELARAEGSAERLERAVRVLEVVARRLAADLGADHPQSLIALANLASAGLDLARGEESEQHLRESVAVLAAVSRRADAVLGEDHPAALTTSANLAMGRLELARAGGSAEGLMNAIDALRSESEHLASAFGQDHPETFNVLAALKFAELELRRMGDPGSDCSSNLLRNDH